MADILPTSTELSDKQEYTDVSVSFTPQLSVGETLVSLNIINRRPNVGIIINGSSFSGQYKDSFNLDSDALTVRMKSDKDGNPDIRVFDSWEKLPPSSDADIIQWKAPKTLTTEYWYEVKLVYDYEAPPPAPPSPTPVRKELTKRYTQIVFGDYDVWAKQLRQYAKGE